MKRASFIFSLLLILLSCSDETKLPANVLDKEKMQAVMWDMIRTGEFLNNFVFSKDTTVDRTLESLLWFDKVYESNNITKDEFERSYAYYKRHPILMKEIMDSLAVRHANPGEEEQHQAPLIPPVTSPSSDKIDSIKQKLSRFPKRDKKVMIMPDSLRTELSR